MTRGHPTVTSHLSRPLLERYAAGALGTGTQDAAWTVEAHLELCAACRRVLADVVEHGTPPQLTALLQQVGARLSADVERSAQTPARGRLARGAARWTRSWTAPATLPRLLMTVLVVAVAVGLDVADGATGRFPSFVLLVAPVAPLAGVSAAWSRGLDPAYELVAASPRAGLDLVLRRTLAVLAVVIPALAAAGALVSVSPARWLLPCLAFCAGTLALGELVGLHRAARGLALVWAVVVVGPSVWLDRAPVVLDAAGRPAWLAALVGAAALLVARRRLYTWPADLH
ncbi:MAG: zf-HC2 domain-containing protein [Acidimicrobiales bacterium]